ncbi:hypothetical protein BC828DRAFT_391712, partial [Blastocladiella britannica]
QLARPPKSREENQRKGEHSAIASCAPTRTCAPPQGQPTACSREAHLSGEGTERKGQRAFASRGDPSQPPGEQKHAGLGREAVVG